MWGGGGGGRGGKRGTVHCLIPLCPPPHSPLGFAVAQNFTKRDPTITPATQATTFMKKNASVAFYREIWCSNRETGRFDKKLGDSRQNRESWQVCSIMALFEGSHMATVIISIFFMCCTICICKNKCVGNANNYQLKKTLADSISLMVMGAHELGVKMFS